MASQDHMLIAMARNDDDDIMSLVWLKYFIWLFVLSVISCPYIPSLSKASVLDWFCFHELRPILLYIHVSGASIWLSSCLFLVQVSAPYYSDEYTQQLTVLTFNILSITLDVLFKLNISFTIPILFLNLFNFYRHLLHIQVRRNMLPDLTSLRLLWSSLVVSPFHYHLS